MSLDRQAPPVRVNLYDGLLLECLLKALEAVPEGIAHKRVLVGIEKRIDMRRVKINDRLRNKAGIARNVLVIGLSHPSPP